jgi:hypothetical protein
MRFGFMMIVGLTWMIGSINAESPFCSVSSTIVFCWSS